MYCALWELAAKDASDFHEAEFELRKTLSAQMIAQRIIDAHSRNAPVKTAVSGDIMEDNIEFVRQTHTVNEVGQSPFRNLIGGIRRCRWAATVCTNRFDCRSMQDRS